MHYIYEVIVDHEKSSLGVFLTIKEAIKFRDQWNKYGKINENYVSPDATISTRKIGPSYSALCDVEEGYRKENKID